MIINVINNDSWDEQLLTDRPVNNNQCCSGSERSSFFLSRVDRPYCFFCK